MIPTRPSNLERARIQARQYGKATATSPSQKQSQPITQMKRDGELLWVFEDADRHERRVQRAFPSASDRFFWVTIAVACGAPGAGNKGRRSAANDLAKQFGHLQKARNDLDAYFQYYRPMQIGESASIGAFPGFGKSPGYFDCAIHLDNPSVDELREAILGLREWLDVNQEDPEYRSFQFNFAFSGHGDIDDEGSAAIVLADKALRANDLASMLLLSIPRNEMSPASCRLDLFLDCCHSGAVAESLTASLLERQSNVDPQSHSRLTLGQLYCACLADEEAFELNQLSHSVFTFAFLNECSRKRPDGAKTLNIGLRDVGWHTDGRQHPLLLDFTNARDFTKPDDVNFKFPSLYHLMRPANKKQESRQLLAVPTVDSWRYVTNPIGEFLQIATSLRDECIDLERDLWCRPDLRAPFSRDEILTNKKFPFL